MPEPRSGVCSDWITPADLCEPCSDYQLDSGLVADAIEAASNLLFAFSGGIFPGECDDVVRPCGGVDGPRFSRMSNGDTWRSLSGGCGCSAPSACGCDTRHRIDLGRVPVLTVEQVLVDGATVDPALYRVDDWRWLVRLGDADGSNPGWPCCQRLDLASDQPETFEVSFTWGRTPPVEGRLAAAALACELIKACSPDDLGECALPSNVTAVVRQGVTYELVDAAESAIAGGNLGLAAVDRFLEAHNPAGKRRRASIWRPRSRRTIRTDT